MFFVQTQTLNLLNSFDLQLISNSAEILGVGVSVAVTQSQENKCCLIFLLLHVINCCLLLSLIVVRSPLSSHHPAADGCLVLLVSETSSMLFIRLSGCKVG